MIQWSLTLPFPGLCDSLGCKCIQWEYCGDGGCEGQKSCRMDITVHPPEVGCGACVERGVVCVERGVVCVERGVVCGEVWCV